MKIILKALVVEDDPSTRESLVRKCKNLGLEVIPAIDLTRAFAEMSGITFDIAIVDIALPEWEFAGFTIVRRLKVHNPLTRIICLTAHHPEDYAEEFSRDVMGSEAFLIKGRPGTEEKLDYYLAKFIEERSRERERELLYSYEPIELLLEQIAPSSKPVLFYGEIGTGKGYYVRKLRDLSQRPMKTINCAALAEGNALLVQLFGAVPQTFTGVGDVPGIFELIDEHWIVFLDEISKLNKAAQGALLNLLEEPWEFQRFPFTDIYPLPPGIHENARKSKEKELKQAFPEKEFPKAKRFYSGYGYNPPQQFKGRIIMATNTSLDDLVRKEEFLPDLFTRLQAFTLEIPPLRERKSDIPKLVEKIIQEDEDAKRKEIVGIDVDAMNLIITYDWKMGNVRELRHTIEAAILRAHGKRLTSKDVFPKHDEKLTH
jgi:DNA-binding NtrC family response regulator